MSEFDYCPDCNGSGEGRYDGSTCQTCKGSGEVKAEEREANDAD